MRIDVMTSRNLGQTEAKILRQLSHFSEPKVGRRRHRLLETLFWRSCAFPRYDLVILALAHSAERVVLPQRIRLKPIPRQNPPQVRMPLKRDPKHVVHL